MKQPHFLIIPATVICLLIVSAFICLPGNGHEKPIRNQPFDKMNFDKVVAYDYEGGKSTGAINIINNGKLAATVKAQKELSPKQVNDITSFLGDSATYGGNTAACFDPHLGLVFYRNNKVVEHISICMECNYLSSSINIPAMQANRFRIDDTEYPAIGFSKAGREKLFRLCSQLNFSHCKDNRSDQVTE